MTKRERSPVANANTSPITIYLEHYPSRIAIADLTVEVDIHLGDLKARISKRIASGLLMPTFERLYLGSREGNYLQFIALTSDVDGEPISKLAIHDNAALYLEGSMPGTSEAMLQFCALLGADDHGMPPWELTKYENLLLHYASQSDPLHKAISEYEMGVVRRLSSVVDLNSLSKLGRTPLHTAILCGNAEALRILTAEGANVNTVLPGYASTEAISTASAIGNVVIISQLLANGADINQADNGSHQPLYSAVRYDKVAAIEYLLAEGAGIDCESLDLAVSSGYTESVKLLIMKGASLAAYTNNGDTPLHTAAIMDRGDLIGTIYSSATNVNLEVVNKGEGNTPLHLAAAYVKPQATDSLVALGANINALNLKGKTPLQLLGSKSAGKTPRGVLNQVRTLLSPKL